MAASLIGLTVILALWGLPALGQSNLAECQAAMKSNKALDVLRPKLAEPADPTLAQLADASLANDEEQMALIEFDRRRIDCSNLWVKENQDLPQQALEAFSRSVRDEQLARADLFTGKLTFGEYNRKAVAIYRALSAEFDRFAQQEERRASSSRDAAIVRGAAAGARQALPTFNPFPKPLICTSTRRGTLVDTFCR